LPCLQINDWYNKWWDDSTSGQVCMISRSHRRSTDVAIWTENWGARKHCWSSKTTKNKMQITLIMPQINFTHFQVTHTSWFEQLKSEKNLPKRETMDGLLGWGFFLSSAAQNTLQIDNEQVHSYFKSTKSGVSVIFSNNGKLLKSDRDKRNMTRHLVTRLEYVCA